MSSLSAEETANRLIHMLDEEETVQVLRDLPERLHELSTRHRSFLETQRWDEIANLQSENANIVQSGMSMADRGVGIRRSAWVDYTQCIHEEADAVQYSIDRCLQETERNSMPRRSKGKDPVLNGLLSSVDELRKRIEDITDIMHLVAVKTVDASGLLSISGDDPGIVNTSANQGLSLVESKSTNVEDVPNTEPFETLLYWESRVRELDGHCINLRNNLSVNGAILDQQQETIENLRLQIAAAAVTPEKTLPDKQADALLMGPLMVIVFVFLGFLATHVVE